MSIISIWAIILYSGFFPFVGCILLLLTPIKLKQVMFTVFNKTFGIHCCGQLRLIDFFLTAEACILAFAMWDTYKHYQQQDLDPRLQRHSNVADTNAVNLEHLKFTQLAKNWRGQRNCYATAWAFTSWWMLKIIWSNEMKMHKLRQDIQRLREQVGDNGEEPGHPHSN